MTKQRDAPHGLFARWRERRRAKRQQALERQYFEHERSADPATSAYVSADNHARRADAYTGSGDVGSGGMSDGGLG